MPTERTDTEQEKKPLQIGRMLRKIREAVRDFPKAALFELAEEGYNSPFEVLVACMISVRTRDEVTVPTARRLFEVARTPEAMAQLTPTEIDERIRPCSFHEAKAYQISEIAGRIVGDYGARLPCDFAALTGFRGVGPKCANLTLGIACGQPTGIGVDVHVHRVTNRWGYVQTRTPEQTMAALQEILPPQFRVQVNALLVPFGKHICTGTRPRCSVCPVLDRCRQVGVTTHR